MLILNRPLLHVAQRWRPVPATPANAILFDNFNSGADGATLAGRAPLVRPNSNTWTVASGTFVTNNRAAEARFDASSTAMLTFDLGDANIDISLLTRFPSTGSNRNAGVMFRRTNASNYWYVTANASNGNFSLIDVTANVQTGIQTVNVGFAANVWHEMRVIANGDVIEGIINGNALIEHTSSTRNTAVIHGLRAVNTITTGGPIVFDNVVIFDPADSLFLVDTNDEFLVDVNDKYLVEV